MSAREWWWWVRTVIPRATAPWEPSAFGIGATEMASVWALGRVLNVEVPGTIKVEVRGDFPTVRTAQGPDPAPDRQDFRPRCQFQGHRVPRSGDRKYFDLRAIDDLQHVSGSWRNRRDRPGGRRNGALFT